MLHIYFIVPYLSPTNSELLSFAFGSQSDTEPLPRWRHRQTMPRRHPGGAPGPWGLGEESCCFSQDFFYFYKYHFLYYTILVKGWRYSYGEVQYRCINPLGSPQKVKSQLQVFPACGGIVSVLAFWGRSRVQFDEFQNFVVEHALSQPITSPTWNDPN